MNTLFAKTVLICGCGFSPLLAADISGHWIFEGDVNGNPVSLDCNLKQTADKFEGACKSKNGDVQLAGEVSDPKVRFSYSVNYEGNTYTLYYSGTLESETSLKGDIQVSGVSGTFAARKETPK